MYAFTASQNALGLAISSLISWIQDAISVTMTEIMQALSLVFILLYIKGTSSNAFMENDTDISNTTDVTGQYDFSEITESTTVPLPTPTDTLPTERDTSFPDQTGQSETTTENGVTDLPRTSTTQSAPTDPPREPWPLFDSFPNPDYSGTKVMAMVME